MKKNQMEILQLKSTVTKSLKTHWGSSICQNGDDRKRINDL